uniref:CHAP domain protein n=1 Tax=Podoviridae sp. ctval4 TaxID=2826585 RepID=A0A8S5N0U6_9CAUD|nr:MAG TPA: CHAP domain protein [Podoviridae sp. ctval4]
MPTYVPRDSTSSPTEMRGNPMWYSDNPFYQSGYGLPNCTCYAWGRYWEVTGERPNNLPTGNAGTWYDTARSRGFKVGSQPALGAILCMGRRGYAGHVCVVEYIADDGTLTVSNSAWRGTYFFLTNNTPANNYLPAGWASSGYYLQGFIYAGQYDPDPDQPPDPGPDPGPGPSWRIPGQLKYWNYAPNWFKRYYR